MKDGAEQPNKIWRAGDPAPDFTIRSSNSARFHFNTAAGRYIVLCFFGSARRETGFRAQQHLARHTAFFNDGVATFFGVSIDPADEAEARVRERVPGFRYFWDFDRVVSARYGALDGETAAPEKALEDALESYRGFTLVLDPMQRVLAHVPHDAAHDEAVDALLKRLPPPGLHSGMEVPAPILVLPRVFEPDFCRHLIGLYESDGGKESGFMRQIDGKTVGVYDDTYKRRSDFAFDFLPQLEPVRAAIRARIHARLVPAIQRAFQFNVTRMERYIVACYEGERHGFFTAHRDNTTSGTAHRRFACTINLNTEDYDGGDLRFPEFGPRTYRAPTGGAVVFSCSLLHEATPVTRGRRYACLPFLYDEAAARIRQANAAALTGENINMNAARAEK